MTAIASTTTIDFDGIAIDFAPDTGPEVIYEGKKGLLLAGVASRAEETDLDGERHEQGSLLDACDMWGASDKPPIWWEHGHDPALGARQIGWATHYDLDPDGLSLEAFIPREIGAAWRGPGAKVARARFVEIYADIRAGRVRGLSIGGGYQTRVGSKSIGVWHLTEVSAGRHPCLPSARFHLLDQGEFDLRQDTRRLMTRLQALRQRQNGTKEMER